MTLLRALWFVLLFVAPRAAFAAGSVTISANTQWVAKTGSSDALTRDTNNLKTATLGDCSADRALLFTATFSNDFSTANSAAQVWVGGSGADCSTLAARTGTTQSCWRVSDANLVPPVSGGYTSSVWVRIQDIMSQDKTKQDAYVNAGSSACKSVPLTNLSVYFMTFDNGGSVGTVGGTFSLAIDTQGPTPPTGLKAGTGNGRLYLEFSAPTTTGQNIAFTDVYCAISSTPSTGGGKDAASASTPDANTIADASLAASDASVEPVDAGAVTVDEEAESSDASGTSSSASGLNCAVSPILVAGEVPPATLPAGMWRCAHATASSSLVPTSVTVSEGPDGKPLENGVNYTMAAAFVDTVGNAGVLSESVCATPEVTVGFYDRYAASGGAASGCALSPGGSGRLALVLLGFMLVLVRRSR